MTKTNVLAARIGGDHIAYLYLLVADDHPIDQQLHQFTSLLEIGVSETKAHPLAEIFYAAGYTGKLHVMLRLPPKLPFLARQSLIPSFYVLATPLVLGQRDHLPEVCLGQPLQLTAQGCPALTQILLTSL